MQTCLSTASLFIISLPWIEPRAAYEIVIAFIAYLYVIIGVYRENRIRSLGIEDTM